MSANEFSPPPPGALAQFDEDFGDWKLKPVVTAGGTNYATLTIGGVAAPVCNVSVAFGDDARPAMPAPIVTPLRVAFEGEADADSWAAFMAAMPAPTWPQWVRITAWDEAVDVPVFEHDTLESFGIRVLGANSELWKRACNRMRAAMPWRSRGFFARRAKRHEKAKAKREKMRSARYAARWEQAHLRERPTPETRVARRARIADGLRLLEAEIDGVAVDLRGEK